MKKKIEIKASLERQIRKNERNKQEQEQWKWKTTEN
jgi:hypothetical protein